MASTSPLGADFSNWRFRTAAQGLEAPTLLNSKHCGEHLRFLGSWERKKNVLELLFCFPSLKEPQRSFWWQAKVPRTSIFPSRDRSWLLMSAESGLVLSLKRKVSPIFKSFSVPGLPQYWPLTSNSILARLQFSYWCLTTDGTERESRNSQSSR